MKTGDRAFPAPLVAACAVTLVFLALGSVLLAAQEQDPPPGEAAGEQAAEAAEPEKAATDDQEGESRTGWAPVRVGGARGGRTVAQKCQSSWENCNEVVRTNLESLWEIHDARRLACDTALREMESACTYAPKPKRCLRRARADSRRCESSANRDQVRQLEQIQRQRKVCLQTYRICVGL